MTSPIKTGSRSAPDRAIEIVFVVAIMIAKTQSARSVAMELQRAIGQRSANPQSAIAIEWRSDTTKQLFLQELLRSKCL